MGKSFMQEHLEAGELTDLPGHCKFCGKEIITVHAVPLPPGEVEPSLQCCSAECVFKIEHFFDDLPAEKLKELEVAIAQAEMKGGAGVH